MGCGASSSTQVEPLAKQNVAPSASKQAAAGPEHEKSHEVIEGITQQKPSRPIWPVQRASRGKWNDLHDAAEEGKEHKLPKLLGKYALDGGDENGWNALMEATEKKHVGVVRTLIDAKANPNLQSKEGWVALTAACEFNSLACAKLLIDAGAKVDVQCDKGWSPLMEAAEKGHEAMLRMMVDAGEPHADLNTKDEKGWTAIMAACEGGNVECVKYLWKKGADHKDKSSYEQGRWTALDEARHKGKRDIVAFMEPIVAAERQLKLMIETDSWSTQEALGYIEKGREVYCMRELMMQAQERLSSSLIRTVSKTDAGANERNQSFDLLVQLGHSDKVKEDAVMLQESYKICEERLRSAQSASELKHAMATTVRADLYPSSELEAAMEDASKQYQEKANLPEGWDVKKMISGLWEGRMLSKTPIEDPAFVGAIQKMVDDCTKKIYTRDRHGEKVPDAMKVHSVVHVQNEQLLAEYDLRRNQIQRDVQVNGLGMEVSASVRSNKPVGGLATLDSKLNEVWLLHGTKKAAADAITTTDFRLDLSGSNAGTLFGSGIYLAEMASKGDEYTEPDEDQLRCLLLCRATLGRVQYTDALLPDPDELTRKCLNQEFHSVLGDREKCRGTFREFVVFDDDQVLPEYVIFYRRVFYGE